MTKAEYFRHMSPSRGRTGRRRRRHRKRESRIVNVSCDPVLRSLISWLHHTHHHTQETQLREAVKIKIYMENFPIFWPPLV